MSQIPLWRDVITSTDILAVFTPDDQYLSRSEIASRLGVSKKKSLINTLEQMVDAGALKRSTEMLANNTPVFLYERA